MGDLAIKDVSEYQLAQLRERAARNHRTVEAEVRALIDMMIPPKDGTITIEELGARARALGLKTPDEATRWIRELRDSR